MYHDRERTHFRQHSSRIDQGCSWRACSVRIIRPRSAAKYGEVGTHPPAAHDIVDMVAKLGSISIKASSKTEFAIGDEFGPLMGLTSCPKGVAVQKATSYVMFRMSSPFEKRGPRTRVSSSVGTTVINLASIIPSLDIDVGEVASPCDLNIFRCFDEVHTFKSSIGDRASTASTSAICDGTVLGITNSTHVSCCDTIRIHAQGTNKKNPRGAKRQKSWAELNERKGIVSEPIV